MMTANYVIKERGNWFPNIGRYTKAWDMTELDFTMFLKNLFLRGK